MTREFRLLEYLMRHAGQVVTRTMLLEHVWDYQRRPYQPSTGKDRQGLRPAIAAHGTRRRLHAPRRTLNAGNIVRSSTFRLALLYVLLLGTSVVILLGFLYWSTAGYMDRQTDATIQAEIQGLAEQYLRRGLKGLSAIITERFFRIDRSRNTPGSGLGLSLVAAVAHPH